MSLQSLVDTLGHTMREERKQYHLKLGELIDFLQPLSESGRGFDYTVIAVEFTHQTVESFDETTLYVGTAHSYRGYYADLAFSFHHFDKHEKDLFAADFLRYLKTEVLDETYEGYKGGDYTMDKDTPLWLSQYGLATGLAVLGVRREGSNIMLLYKQVDTL